MNYVSLKIPSTYQAITFVSNAAKIRIATRHLIMTTKPPMSGFVNVVAKKTKKRIYNPQSPNPPTKKGSHNVTRKSFTRQ